MQVLFYYRILGSDSGIAEDSSRFKFSVLRHCVVEWVVPDISKNCGHIPEELNFQILFPMWYSFETHYNFLWGIYDLWWWEFQ